METMVKRLVTMSGAVGYHADMDSIIILIAVLAATTLDRGSSSAFPAVSTSAAARAPASLATRSERGATAIATVSVRIVTRAARLTADGAPPFPAMVARAGKIAAANGRLVDALVYDFE